MINLQNLVTFKELRVFIWAIKYGLLSSVISKLTKRKNSPSLKNMIQEAVLEDKKDS